MLAAMFFKEDKAMASRATIRPEQITRARELLQKLPEKDDRKTRPEAAKLLEKDFKKAMQKGYSAKEISAILKSESIIIPAYLVKDFLSERGETSRPRTAAQCPQRDTSPVVHDSSDAQ